MGGVRPRTLPFTEVTQRVRNHRIPCRPHLQGDPAPLRLRHSARKLTDDAGLVLLRRLWDRLDLGSWLDQRTAVDDLDGNALLWKLGTLAYQTLHGIRTLALSGSWWTATPDRLRSWMFRLPDRFTDHARKSYLQLRDDEPLGGLLLQALRRIARLRGLTPGRRRLTARNDSPPPPGPRGPAAS